MEDTQAIVLAGVDPPQRLTPSREPNPDPGRLLRYVGLRSLSRQERDDGTDNILRRIGILGRKSLPRQRQVLRLRERGYRERRGHRDREENPNRLPHSGPRAEVRKAREDAQRPSGREVVPGNARRKGRNLPR